MSAGSPILPSRELLDRIEPFRRRVMQLDASRIVLLAVTVVVAYLLVLMWLDTIIDLPASVRWGSSRIGLFAALMALILTIAWRMKRITHDGIAHQIDDSINSGGQVLAGLQLSSNPVQPAGLYLKARIDRRSTHRDTVKVAHTGCSRHLEQAETTWYHAGWLRADLCGGSSIDHTRYRLASISTVHVSQQRSASVHRRRDQSGT